MKPASELFVAVCTICILAAITAVAIGIGLDYKDTLHHVTEVCHRG